MTKNYCERGYSGKTADRIASNYKRTLKPHIEITSPSGVPVRRIKLIPAIQVKRDPTTPGKLKYSVCVNWTITDFEDQ